MGRKYPLLLLYSHAVAPIIHFVAVAGYLKPPAGLFEPDHCYVGQPLLPCCHGCTRSQVQPPALLNSHDVACAYLRAA